MTEVQSTGGAPSSTGESPRHRGPVSANVSAAKTPVTSSSLGALGLLWAAALIALGVVAIRDALVGWGLLDGPAWFEAVIDAAGRLEPGVGLLVVASIVGVLGLVLVWLALRPRRKRGIPVSAASGVYLRYQHLSRLLAARAETLEGVVSAHASARKRKVNVRVRGVDGVDADALHSRVQTQVADQLAVLDKPVRARVRIEGGAR